jgi:hypothetical protein
MIQSFVIIINNNNNNNEDDYDNVCMLRCNGVTAAEAQCSAMQALLDEDHDYS